MAISRHKVLSEMQQQLEMASSKCGNLQKQLEIVKNKVRQSSTTNLLYTDPPENKENKVKTDEDQIISEADREKEYEKALSISSSSTEDVNEERDVNIIKVFYDRLGQMDYPKGQVELSDISSEENDLDIDQLLSSVNFSVKNNGNNKNDRRKEKRNDKKAKERVEKTIATSPKRKTFKGKNITKIPSPYESPFMKPVKQTPIKKKNMKNLQNLTGSDSYSTRSNRGAVKPRSQQGQVPRVETDKLKRRKAQNAYVGMPMKNARRAFQEPTQRVMNLANELRKTKSSTAAERKGAFSDSRSLTRLNSKALPEVEEKNTVGEATYKPIPPKSGSLDRNEVISNGSREMAKTVDTTKAIRAVGTNACKVGLRVAKNEAAKLKKEEGQLLKKPTMTLNKSMQDKETSLSDLTSSHTVVVRKSDPPTVSKSNSYRLKGAGDAQPIETPITPGREFKEKHFEPKPKFNQKSTIGQQPPSWNSRKKPMVVGDEGGTRLGETRTMNGVVSRQPEYDSKLSSEVKKRVDMFEKNTPSEVSKDATLDLKKGVEKNKVTGARKATPSITRTNSSTMFEGSFRRSPPSMVSSVPQAQPIYREKELADFNPMTVSQIKRMKDNFMKFNSIPFIVGQSTTKSYHIGLNLQETYSLFKQTPSMTALMVSKYADADHHSNVSRARSTRTGYTGKSTSSVKGRESCPACDPVPEPSPEQKVDPWAVPQDEAPVLRVCTCFPKRMVSFEQVLNQLYFSNMNIVKLHPSFLPSKDGISEENEDVDGKDKPSLQHKPTNTLYYTKLLRSIQNLKDNMMG